MVTLVVLLSLAATLQRAARSSRYFFAKNYLIARTHRCLQLALNDAFANIKDGQSWKLRARCRNFIA